jgi:hypothetical protein
MKTVSSRGREVAELIRDRVEFKTYGAMRAEVVSGMTPYAYVGYLNADERKIFEREAPRIAYVVYSYGTPIAWFTTTRRGGKAGRWHRVAQKFSITTSKHQGKLYLI